MAKAFLAFDDAQYINGETITMDGGMTGYARETLLDLIGKGRS
jgi:NAD(P)-dependent dehydrogenase (short-subunit alcohol dehydrogenase family)